jgi:single-strand DNA-binding protein
VNIVVLQGKVSRVPEERVLATSQRLTTYELAVQPPEGRPEPVPVVWYEAPASALRLEPGTQVVVTGRVRQRFFRAGGSTQSRTEVVAAAVVACRSRRRAADAVQQAVEEIVASTGE